MPEVTLCIEPQEFVDWTAHDNRGGKMQANKFSDSEPAVDLVARSRYRLRVRPLPAGAFPACGRVLLAQGLLVQPLGEGVVESVVVLNLGDRMARLCNGQRLDDGQPEPAA